MDEPGRSYCARREWKLTSFSSGTFMLKIELFIEHLSEFMIRMHLRGCGKTKGGWSEEAAMKALSLPVQCGCVRRVNEPLRKCCTSGGVETDDLAGRYIKEVFAIARPGEGVVGRG